jgi:hypothetical protein
LNAARSHQNCLTEPDFEEKGNDDSGCVVDDATVGHIQLVTSLIEGRWLGLSEIFAMLDKILRQHSMDYALKLPYGMLCRRKNPP